MYRVQVITFVSRNVLLNTIIKKGRGIWPYETLATSQ